MAPGAEISDVPFSSHDFGQQRPLTDEERFQRGIIAGSIFVNWTAAGTSVVATTFPRLGNAMYPPAATATSGELDWSIVAKGETRVEHITINHGQLNLQKPVQGVYYGDPVAVTNDAWAIAGANGIKPIQVGRVDFYLVPRPNSGFAGGYSGQLQNLNTVTIITQQGTSRIITGYPGNGMPLLKPLP